MLSALMIGTTACGGSSEKKDDTSKNMQANEEVTGKIRIYTSMYEDIIANMKPALKKKFPNCEIEFFQGGTGTLQTDVYKRQINSMLKQRSYYCYKDFC